MKEIITNIFEDIKKNWEWVVVVILLLWFYLSKDSRLISGGILLLFLGFKRYYLTGIREKRASSSLIGILLIYAGILALTTKFLLNYSVDVFISFTLIIFCCVLLAYAFFMASLDKKINFFIVLPILAFTFLAEILTMKSLINSISNDGFSGGWIYFASIVFFLSLIFVCFLIFKLIFYPLKNILNYPIFNNYFYLFLSTSTTIFIGGFFYLVIFPEHPLETFLVILSLAFVTAFAVVSSIRSIMSPPNVLN